MTINRKTVEDYVLEWANNKISDDFDKLGELIKKSKKEENTPYSNVIELFIIKL